MAAVVICCSASAATNTHQRLDKYAEDIVQAWTDYAKDSQKSVRDQRISDINQQFKKDIATLEPPPNTTIERSVNALITAVGRTNTLLKFEKMQGDRLTYITSCCDVLKRDIPLSTDFSSPRTTQQAYDLLLNSLTSARDTLRTLNNEQKSTVYQQINTCMTDVIKRATPPAKPDPAELMDQNIKEARRRFPITSPELETANRSIVTLLESVAKQIEQQSVKH